MAEETEEILDNSSLNDAQESQPVDQVEQVESPEVEVEEIDVDDPDYSFGVDFQGTSTTSAAPVAESGDYVKLTKAEYESLKNAAEAAKHVSTNPVAQAIVNWVEQGNKVEDFVQRGLYVDYDNLPASDIYKQKLKSVGRFSDEQINQKVEYFLDKDEIDQELEIQNYRDELKTKQYDRLSQLNKVQAPDPEVQKRVVQKFDSDFELECDKWEKKGEFFGVQYTPETSKRIKEAIESINVNGLLVNKDGTLNAKNAHFMFFSFLHAKDIQKAAIGKAKQMEREKVASIHQNAGRTQGIKTNKGGMEKIETAESYADAVNRRIREAKEKAQAQQRKPY